MALHNLKTEAFEKRPAGIDSFDEWEQLMKKRSPTFLFWDIVMKYEMLILLLVRAHRERNFDLFLAALELITPLFFSLDHVNYARWIPIHVRDMKSLPSNIMKEFKDHGHWVLSKTGNRFSSIPLDQVHEQANKVVKGSGGAVGLTENPAAFRYV